jgi:hypothetical protein
MESLRKTVVWGDAKCTNANRFSGIKILYYVLLGG